MTTPSFAIVCVGDKVKATGAISTDNIVTATVVTVIPPRPQHVSGTVASVNGSSATNTCGTAGTSGDFTVTSHSTTYTVDVGANSTNFQEKGVPTPSFAIVCVGDKVKATGAISTDNIVTATVVTVIPPRPQHVSGTVASVNGSSATNTCGTAGTSGDFTVTSHSTTYTVDVGANSTNFQEKGVPTPSFAIVCVGDKVKATGAISTDNIVTATVVTVIPPRPQHVSGTVASVNGSSATNTCGTAGTSGDFTVTSHSTTYTVDVGANSTNFQEKGAPTPSFAIVCVGDKVKATGAISTDNIVTATVVTGDPAPSPARLGHRGLGERLERDQHVRDGGDLGRLHRDLAQHHLHRGGGGELDQLPGEGRDHALVRHRLHGGQGQDGRHGLGQPHRLHRHDRDLPPK